MKYLALLFTLAAGLLASAAHAADAVKLELKDGDRVAFIGNTFIEREQADGYIETMLTTRYPDRNITFRNLGYSADDVTGSARGLCAGWSTFEGADKAFDRLRKLVAEFKPTVLILNYGMTESFSGAEGIPTFTANYNKMLDALSTAAGTSPRVILMSPNTHDNLGKPWPDPSEHNKNLKLYSDAIGEIAAKRNAQFIDLFSMTMGATHFTSNGIHLTPLGYWWIAQSLEIVPAAPKLEIKLDAKGTGEAVGGKVSDVKVTGAGLSFVVTSQTVPPPPIPLEPTASAPHPFDADNGATVVISGLKPGIYELKTGDNIQAKGSADEWAKGVKISRTSERVEADALRKLIVAKNFDYFNYQRPDNDAYILAFRRGEQGRNAVEIPQFLPLVEEKEKQIAALRVPKPVAYTLELVK